MRILIQRVTKGSVSIDGELVGQTGPGLVVLVGVTHTDTEADAEYLANKCVNLRIFTDENGKMNRSLLDLGSNLEIHLAVALGYPASGQIEAPQERLPLEELVTFNPGSEEDR